MFFICVFRLEAVVLESLFFCLCSFSFARVDGLMVSLASIYFLALQGNVSWGSWSCVQFWLHFWMPYSCSIRGCGRVLYCVSNFFPYVDPFSQVLFTNGELGPSVWFVLALPSVDQNLFSWLLFSLFWGSLFLFCCFVCRVVSSVWSSLWSYLGLCTSVLRSVAQWLHV